MSLAPPFLEPNNCGRCRVRGGDDRRDDDDEPLVKIGRRLEKILDRNQRFRFAIEADMGDAGGRHEIEHAFRECHSAAQNGSKHQLLSGNSRRHHPRQRRFNFDIRQRQVSGHLVAQQHSDLFEEFAEGFRRDFLVADQRQLVLDQRVLDDCDAFHGSLP